MMYTKFLMLICICLCRICMVYSNNPSINLTPSVIDKSSLGDTLFLKNGQAIAFQLVESTKEDIYYQEIGGTGHILNVRIRDVAHIKRANIRYSPTEALQKDTFYKTIWKKITLPKGSKYDTILTKDGVEKVVYIVDEFANYVSYKDTSATNTQLYQIAQASIDTIKHKIFYKKTYIKVENPYIYVLNQPEYKFYADVSLGMGIRHGRGMITPNARFGSVLRVSMGYQFKPTIGFGMSYIASVHNQGIFVNPKAVNSFSIDYRLKFGKNALMAQYGIVADVTQPEGEYDKLHVDKSTSRPIFAFMWTHYIKDVLIGGVHIGYSSFQITNKINGSPLNLKKTHENFVNLFLGVHLPTHNRFKRIYINQN
jgi:hypothetical protein